MSSEVDDFFSGTEDTGERVDTSRPAALRAAADEIEDPHREDSVVTYGAAAARRGRPEYGRYAGQDIEPEPELFDTSAPLMQGFDDDREAEARARRDRQADEAEAAAVAAASGDGAHREEDLTFFGAVAESQPDQHFDESSVDADDFEDDNDAFFHQVAGMASALDDAPAEYEPPPGSDEDFDIESIESGAKRKRTVKRTVALSVLAAAVIAVGGWALYALATSLMDSTREETEAQYAAPDWATSVPEATDQGPFDAIFSSSPAFTVEAEGDTYWVAAGIVDVTDEELRLHSTSDGEEVGSLDYGADDFEYLVEFRHEDKPVVGLRTSEGITAIRADGETAEIDFDEGALRTEGEAPLVYIHGTAHRIDFDEGLVEIEINNDLPIVAADDDLLYQVTGDGTLVTIPDGSDDRAEEVDMIAPTDAAEFTGWAGAGHGFAGAYWNTDDGDYLGVHDAETGEATAYVPVETDSRWEVGRGLTAAVVDRYAISLITGEILAADPQIAGAYSHYAYTDDRRFFDSDDEAHYVYDEDSRVIGASGTTVFVRTATGNIDAYDRSDAVV